MHRFTRFGIVNAYFVGEDDGVTLIDTTLKGAGKALLAAAPEGKPITRVVLTHGHADHVGALDEIAGQLPGAEFLIPARDARILGGDKSMEAGEAQSKIKGGWPKVKTQLSTFEPGETIGSLQVIAAPGHTPGQVALLDPRDGTLYCGDAFATIGEVRSCARASWKFPLPGLATWDKATATKTAHALIDLDPRTLAPGHGKPVPDPVAAMRAGS